MNIVYHNGEIKNSDQVTFHSNLFSLNYSVCAFEGIRSYTIKNGENSSIFELEKHIDRFLNSADFLKIKSYFLNRDHLIETIKEIIRNQKKPHIDFYIRPIVFYGEGIMDLKKTPEVQVCIFTQPIQEKKVGSIRIEVSNHKRDLKTITKKISLNYFHSYLSLQDMSPKAQDVLLLDENEFITETSAHNIFFKINERLVITPSKEFCLPGITRQVVIHILEELGVKVEERPININEVFNFQSCFTTSTASEIRVINEINDHIMDSNCNLIEKIIKKYNMLVRSS